MLLSIRRMSESLKRFRDELTGPQAREILREALQEVAERQREAARAARWNPFDDPF